VLSTYPDRRGGWDPVGDSRRTRRAPDRREAHYGGGRAGDAASRGASRGPRGGDLGRGVERVEPGRVVEVERPVVAQRGEVVRGVGDGEEQRALRRVAVRARAAAAEGRERSARRTARDRQRVEAGCLTRAGRGGGARRRELEQQLRGRRRWAAAGRRRGRGVAAWEAAAVRECRGLGAPVRLRERARLAGERGAGRGGRRAGAAEPVEGRR